MPGSSSTTMQTGRTAEAAAAAGKSGTSAGASGDDETPTAGVDLGALSLMFFDNLNQEISQDLCTKALISARLTRPSLIRKKVRFGVPLPIATESCRHGGRGRINLCFQGNSHYN